MNGPADTLPQLPVVCDGCDQPIRRLDDLIQIAVAGTIRQQLHRQCQNTRRYELSQSQLKPQDRQPRQPRKRRRRSADR